MPQLTKRKKGKKVISLTRIWRRSIKDRSPLRREKASSVPFLCLKDIAHLFPPPPFLLRLALILYILFVENLGLYLIKNKIKMVNKDKHIANA